MKDDGTLRLRTRMEERKPIITQEMYLQHWLVSQASAMIRFYDSQRDDGHRPSNHGSRSWLGCRDCG